MFCFIKVRASQENTEVLRRLIFQLDGLIECACWGRPLGSTQLWARHLAVIRRINSIADSMIIRKVSIIFYLSIQITLQLLEAPEHLMSVIWKSMFIATALYYVHLKEFFHCRFWVLTKFGLVDFSSGTQLYFFAAFWGREKKKIFLVQESPWKLWCVLNPIRPALRRIWYWFYSLKKAGEEFFICVPFWKSSNAFLRLTKLRRL